ncbi:MAG: hypothetical protein LBU73_07985 [Helicobacteraceae bacterium]|jgi:hypothetical protein|nr:hypothetical protein [Helicobacteraceae bacterium]
MKPDIYSLIAEQRHSEEQTRDIIGIDRATGEIYTAQMKFTAGQVDDNFLFVIPEKNFPPNKKFKVKCEANGIVYRLTVETSEAEDED